MFSHFSSFFWSRNYLNLLYQWFHELFYRYFSEWGIKNLRIMFFEHFRLKIATHLSSHSKELACHTLLSLRKLYSEQKEYALWRTKLCEYSSYFSFQFHSKNLPDLNEWDIDWVEDIFDASWIFELLSWFFMLACFFLKEAVQTSGLYLQLLSIFFLQLVAVFEWQTVEQVSSWQL